MKRFYLLCIMFLFFIVPLFSNVNYTDEQKEFTFIIPKDWKIISSSKLKYNMVIGELINDFTQNIIINSEEFDGNIKDYINKSIDKIKKERPDISIIKSEEFKTTSKIVSWKVVATNEFNNIFLKHCYYVFKNRNIFFVLVASALNDSYDEFEKMMDKSIKTFRFLTEQNSIH